MHKGSALAFITLTLAAICTQAATEWNVLDHGARPDGIFDCTEAFQKALDSAGAAGGGKVIAPTGEYRFDGFLEIPYGVTLQGTMEVPSTYQPTESPLPFTCTTFLVYGGKGTNDEPAFIRLAGKMAALRGVLIRYPEATTDVVPPVPYPPAILMNQWVTTVENVCLLNPYEGIRMREAGRHLVRNVHGYPTWRGMVVDWIQDVGRIENCHFSPMGFPFDPDGPYMRWVFENGVAFDFRQSDWQYVTNTFCFGYNIGYKFSESEKGVTNGNFLGIAADCCRTPVLVEQAAPEGLLITNGEFVGQWNHGNSIGIDMAPGCRGTINLSNSSFWGPFDRLVRVRGRDARIMATACNFVSWDNDGDDSEAIQVDAGRVIIQGCFFREARSHVRVGPEARAVTLTGNQAPGGLQVENHAGARTMIATNEEDLREWPPEASIHYRIRLGEEGDSRFLVHWGAQGDAIEWPGENPGRRRWAKPGSALELPVVPGIPYTLLLEAYVPEDVVGPGNGLFLDGVQIAALSQSGLVTIKALIPPQTSDRILVSCEGKSLKALETEPLFRLFFAAKTCIMKGEHAERVPFEGNIGAFPE